MDIQHVNFKVFVENEDSLDPSAFIEVFHEWIRTGAQEELLIDVADYRHVPSGPGVILIGLQADYSIDHTGGRWGLRYNRKSPVEGTNADRLSQALGSTAKACGMLEAHFAGDNSLRFRRDEFELFINDRALAPNTAETYQALQPEFEAFVKNAIGHSDFTMRYHSDPRTRFGFTIKAAKPFELEALGEPQTS